MGPLPTSEFQSTPACEDSHSPLLTHSALVLNPQPLHGVTLGRALISVPTAGPKPQKGFNSQSSHRPKGLCSFWSMGLAGSFGKEYRTKKPEMSSRVKTCMHTFTPMYIIHSSTQLIHPLIHPPIHPSSQPAIHPLTHLSIPHVS